MTARHAREVQAQPPRGERREGAPAKPPSLPAGVRPEVLEAGRRIIEGERAVQELLEAYDRGEWRRR